MATEQEHTGRERRGLDPFPDGEGWIALQTGRIKTRAPEGTSLQILRGEHFANIMIENTLGLVFPEGGLSSGEKSNLGLDVIVYEYTPYEKKKTGGVVNHVMNYGNYGRKIK